MRRKQLSAQVREAGEDRVQFVISTGSVDRDNDTVNPAGWRLENYRRSPVVLFAHDYRALPVARASEIGVVGGQLCAVAEFVPAAIYPFAKQVLDMLRAGFLNAVSVGFRPLKYVQNAQRGGFDFIEQELLEFSVVPVPANPEALVVGRGVDEGAVKAWLSRGARSGGSVLDLFDAPVLDLADDDEAVLDLVDAPRRDLVDVDASTLGRAIREVVVGELPVMVRQAVAGALAHARGRVD